MLSLHNIVKSYSKQTILKNISLTIPKNSITGIIGPNGAGKSTIIKTIAGIEQPDSGEIIINDKKVINFDQKKEYFSYMPEHLTIYPEYSVKYFLEFFHNTFNTPTADVKNELLQFLNLKIISKKKISQLSKGWHQRLKLYIALYNPRPIVILDEPFDGFDPIQMLEIINIFKNHNTNGKTFILSIHQLAVAEKICNNFILLNNGYLIANGDIKKLAMTFSVENQNLEQIFIKALKK